MQLRSEIQLTTMMQSLKNVVIPAIEPGNQLAQEQAQLMLGMLNLMSQQLPLQYAFDRDELTRLLASTDKLLALENDDQNFAGILNSLADSASSAKEVLQRCGADPSELLKAIRELRDGVSTVMATVVDTQNEQLISSVEAEVMDLSREQLLRDRALLVSQGWEPDKDALPAIEDLLGLQ